MPLDPVKQDFAIAVGVLSAVAVAASAFQTSTWMKRQGLLAIECTTALKFILLTCGNLASVFFLALLGFSLWWFILYKVIISSDA